MSMVLLCLVHPRCKFSIWILRSETATSCLLSDFFSLSRTSLRPSSSSQGRVFLVSASSTAVLSSVLSALADSVVDCPLDVRPGIYHGSNVFLFALSGQAVLGGEEVVFKVLAYAGSMFTTSIDMRIISFFRTKISGGIASLLF